MAATTVAFPRDATQVPALLDLPEIRHRGSGRNPVDGRPGDRSGPWSARCSSRPSTAYQERGRRLPGDLGPYCLTTDADVVPELVRERRDDSQPSPVLVIIGLVTRSAPLTRPSVGHLDPGPGSPLP